MLSKAGKAVPCLPDNPDRNFSANASNDKIDIDENLFTSLVVGYSELIDDSRVRFRIIGDITNWAMSQPITPTAGESFSPKSEKRPADMIGGRY